MRAPPTQPVSYTTLTGSTLLGTTKTKADGGVCQIRHVSSARSQDCPGQTHTKGSAQYSANMVTIMSTTISSLVKSVAVTSMKTLVVSSVILVWSELILNVSQFLGVSLRLLPLILPPDVRWAAY